MTHPSEQESFETNILIPSDNHENDLALTIKSGEVIFIVGKNGTGKSALLHYINQVLGDRSVYFPGSRGVYFDNQTLSISKEASKQIGNNLHQWNLNTESRWKPLGGSARNERLLFELLSKELNFGYQQFERIRTEAPKSNVVAEMSNVPTPLRQLNAVLSQSNLPFRLEIVDGELKSRKGSSLYSYALLSDGERAALLFATQVLMALPNSKFVVDEPELYLHPSIIVPLFRSLLRSRKDCSFVFSTHSLELPFSFPKSSLVSVRACTWYDSQNVKWQMDFLEDFSVVPESFRLDILGSRKIILFIEGNSQSLDASLYSILFPNVTLVPKSSCSEVKRSVLGIRQIPGFHHVAAFGIIDCDGITPEEAKGLKSNGIFPLEVFSVESLYYCDEVVTALSKVQGNTFGINSEQLKSDVICNALACLASEQDRIHLVLRASEYSIREQIINAIPSREDLMKESQIKIEVKSPVQEEKERLNKLIDALAIFSIISKYPVRQSQILSSIAKSLKFQKVDDYEKAALAEIQRNDDLRILLKSKLSELSSAFEEVDSSKAVNNFGSQNSPELNK